MASALVGLRFFTFGIFIVCSTVLCSVAVWNISLVTSVESRYNEQIAAYMIFLGAFGLVWIFPLIFIDLIRSNALTSRVWFEVIWLAIFWIMELSGAAALSAIVPSNLCLPRRGKVAANVCLSGKLLLGFAWVITLMLLAYMVTLAIFAIIHHSTDPNVWHETVREYPWFSTRSTLSSTPPSPVVEKAPGVPILKHPRPKAAFTPAGLTRSLSPLEDPIQPVPTFDRIPQPSYQPPQRRYQGLHFAATSQDPVSIIDPTFTRPREAPRPPVKVQSLYPEHLQAHIPMEARNNLYDSSRQLESQGPPLVGNWSQNSQGNRHSRRLPPVPRSRINTEANSLTQQPLSSIPLDQRVGLFGTAIVSSPGPYNLGSPVLGPQSASTRRQPPPPLNLDGISNTYNARR